MKTALRSFLAAIVVGSAAPLCSALGQPTQAVTLKIEAQPMKLALNDFARQTGLQVIFPSEEVARDLTAPAVVGRYSPEEALQQLLNHSGLRYQFINAQTVAIRTSAAATTSSDDRERLQSGLQRVAQSGPARARAADEAAAAAEGAGESDAKGIPEVLVKGRKTVNADIRRTEEDPQPYVVFDAEEIQRSQATTLSDFFKTRLPMNTLRTSSNQDPGSAQGGSSLINLRGLGANQTIILVDGRRMPSINLFGSFVQPDINGIPLTSVERVEILPSTASGIYGGGATGGVVNIITKKDYVGTDINVVYGSTQRGDAANQRIDASSGFSTEDGRTRVFLSGSYAQSDPILVHDRDFAQRARNKLSTNNPAAFTSLTTPVAGYTSNIRSANGSNLVLKSNGTQLNSSYTSVPIGYAGPLTDGGAALVANAGKYNLSIPETPNYGGLDSLLAGTTASAATLNLRRDFGERVDGFLDLSWLRNRALTNDSHPLSSITVLASAPNNPFTTDINVGFPVPNVTPRTSAEDNSLRMAAGMIWRLPRNWVVASDYVWSRANRLLSYSSAIFGDPDGPGPGVSVNAALANGTLDVLRDINAFPLDWSPYTLPTPGTRRDSSTELNNVALRLSGPLLNLPAGALVLSSALEYRKEEASDVFSDSVGSTGIFTTSVYPARSQENKSVYVEARAPLISEAQRFAFARSLELQVSGRWDGYDTNQPNPTSFSLTSRAAQWPTLSYVTNDVEATSYTVGLRYSPIQDVVLRASRGTGFLPPSVVQLVPNPPLTFAAGQFSFLVDPRRGGLPVQSAITRITGGNAGLTAEESASWSVGVIFTPHVLPGLRVSLDYTRIEKSNEIAGLDQQQVLDLENLFPTRVTRLPLTAQDQALGYTGGVLTGFDVSQVNASNANLEAYDFQADYSWQTANWGEFHFYSVATYQPLFERRFTSASAYANTAGHTGGVLKWKGNAGLNWDKGPWTVGWNAQYFDDYFLYSPTAIPSLVASIVLNQGSGKVPSQVYHDLFATFRFGDATRFAGGSLRSTEISIGIQNVFDRSPPILAATAGSLDPLGTYSAYADPRLRRFTVNVRRSF